MPPRRTAPNAPPKKPVAEHLDDTHADLELRRQLQSRGLKAEVKAQVYRTDPSYVAFDKAKACILNPDTIAITANDSRLQIVAAHFWGMFDRTNMTRRHGKEYGQVKSAQGRLVDAAWKGVIADPGAMAEIKNARTLAERRAHAFWNMMDAYFVYITALAKSIVPLGSADAAPADSVTQAPPPPQGYAWANVREDVDRATLTMTNDALPYFGYTFEYPSHMDDMVQTIQSWAKATQLTRGHDVGFDGTTGVEAWTEVIVLPQVGRKKPETVRKTYLRDTGKSIVYLAALFVEHAAKTIAANITAKNEAERSEREQRRARRAFTQTAIQKFGRGAELQAKELEQMKSIVVLTEGPKGTERANFLTSGGAQAAETQAAAAASAGSAARSESGAPAAPAQPFDFFAQLVGAGGIKANPFGNARRKSSLLLTRYPRVY
jgi:hypothetical protein